MQKLAPMMGWSSWNQFHQHINEDVILGVAQSMKESGLLAAGYRYINLDDCWQASERDMSGRLCFDVGSFPSKAGIVKKLNNLGFKVGLYSSCGALTCEDMPGSYGCEEIDAQTFADWGVEYLKYDYCHVRDLPTDPHFESDSFANATPPVLYIGVAPLDGSAPEIQLTAADALLTEPAVLENGAITGLDCPRGAARFTVNVPKSGQYQIAVGYIKQRSPYRRFALLIANDGAVQVWFPPTSGWYSPARVTVNIVLKEGENALVLNNPIRGQQDDTILRYTRMGEALKKAAPAGRPIYFSICEHGRTQPWTWASDFGGSWRISGDISANWGRILHCYEVAVDLWEYQKAGSYNDPDMLEVGVGDLSADENLSHFALWCMMSAPLILGMDTRKISAETIKIITNQALITLNQDALMLQASRFQLQEGLDLLLKPLADGSCAVCVFNKSDRALAEIKIDLKANLKQDERLDLQIDDSLVLQNLLDSAGDWVRLNKDGVLAIDNLRSHCVAVYIIKN